MADFSPSPEGVPQASRSNISLAFALTLVLARLCTIFMHHPFFAPDENFGYYLLSYRIAFTPRAIVGTVADLLREYTGLGFKAFFLLCFGYTLVCYLVACRGAVALLQRFQSKSVAILFGLFVLALPSTFHVANLKTMFDIFILSGFLFSAFCIYRGWLLAVLPVIALMILTHEASLFLYVPSIWGLIVWRYGITSRRGWLYVSLAFLSATATFLTLLYFRMQLLATPGALEQLNERLAQLDSSGARDGANYLITLNLGYLDHIKSVWQHFFCEQFSPHQLAINFISFLLMAPAFLVIARLWRQAWKTLGQLPRFEKWRYIVLFASCFGGLAMFIVAHDYIRWCTAIVICNLLALLLVYSELPEAALPEFSDKQKLRWAGLSLFYLCLDPPGAVAFSIAEIIAYPIYHLCL